MDLITELSASLTEMDNAVSEMSKYSEELAKAENTYKIALKNKALELDNSGMKVTLIQLAIHGYVADERLLRDIANSRYEVAKEKLNAIKLRCRLLDAQINREYGGGYYGR